MDFTFSGQARSRPTINLGGNGTSTSGSSLAATARRQRQARDALRRQDAASRTLQRVWRGRQVAAQQRLEFVTRLQSVATTIRDGSSASSATEEVVHQVVLASTLLIHIASGRVHHLARPPAQSALGSYLDAARTPIDDGNSNKPALALLFAPPIPPPDRRTHVRLLLRVSRLLLRVIASPTQFAAEIVEGALEVIRFLAASSDLSLSSVPGTAEPKGGTLPSALLAPLIIRDHEWFQALRSHILSFPASRKSSPATIPVAIDLALVPFTLFSPDSQEGQSVTRDFVQELLSIPVLASRIPVASLTTLVLSMPYEPVVQLLSQPQPLAAASTTLPPSATVAQLANFLALANKRVPHLPHGKAIATYLTALTNLQAALVSYQTFERVSDLPPDRTQSPSVDESSESVLDAGRLPNQLDEATSKALMILPSETHISALLAQSNRFSASTRPALFAFLATTLNAGWPSTVREKLISNVMYSTSMVARSTDRTSTATGGLIREIWRGWVRTSRLGKALGSVAAGGAGQTRSLLSSLEDPSTKADWPPLIVLSELYSRALLTIGDDEFLSSGGGRNPLTVDEVSTFSGLLRNLAFTLYWNEGSGVLSSEGARVPGSTISFARLRELITKLTQQLHARDVRHNFMADGAWLMVPTDELPSFTQSVVTEEKALFESEDQGQEADTGGDGGGGGEPMDVDNVTQVQRMRDVRRNATTKRMNAFLTPRLGVLNQIPFVVPFEVRVEIFRQFIQLDRDRLGIVDSRAVWLARQRARVRRGHVAEDGYDQLNVPGDQLKGPIEITFIDKFGQTEMGIDGGGLFKEFLTDVIKEAFDTNRGLWLANDQQEIYPNPHSYAQSTDALAWYGFLGRILGKAIYEGILVDVKFATFFLSKWVGSLKGGNAYLDDLASVASLDSELYKGLVYLKNHPEQVDDLALNFTVTDSEFGVQHTHDLVPHGSSIAVTAENRLSYIYRMSHYRLSTQIARQASAFFTGLSEMVDPRWLRMLDPSELRILISGSDSAVDMADLREHTLYSGYDPHDDTITWLWEVLDAMAAEDKRAFVKFVTSCPSAPLLGFSQLNPRFAVSRNGDDVTRLPTASTCVNLLKLPRYTSRAQLQQKLLYAIHAHAGFDFS